MRALARNHQSLQQIKPIKPVAKYPVRFSFFVLAGLPACRFDGASSYRGFPTFPNNLVQWYGNLSGHGRGGGCAKNIIFLSHSLLACPKTRPTPNKETNFDVKSRKGFQMSNESLHHKEKMQKIKSARDKMMEKKSSEKGLIIINTGKGKGKSSSAFGMIFRCIAHQMPCGVIQFIKGAWSTGERTLIEEKFSNLCEFYAMGEGFTWETQDKERDIKAASKAWEKAKLLIKNEKYRMILLDEINIALRYNYLDQKDVVSFLKNEKPEKTHVVLTGRNAPDELIEIADLVTDMTLIKHPFRSGIKAQKGTEF